MAREPRKHRSGEPALNEEPPAELDFEKGDERDGRAGDRKPEGVLREEYPAERVREAGQSGGEALDDSVDNKVTADDLAPETLLDENRSRTPAARRERDSQDTVLSDVGEAQIGAGTGKDEAELARDEGEDDESYEDEAPRRKPRGGKL